MGVVKSIRHAAANVAKQIMPRPSENATFITDTPSAEDAQRRAYERIAYQEVAEIGTAVKQMEEK